MSLAYIALAVLITLTVLLVLYCVFAEHVRRQRDVPAETQDDFTVSAARWGYLHDKRRG